MACPRVCNWLGSCSETLELTLGSSDTIAAALRRKGLSVKMFNLAHAGIGETILDLVSFILLFTYPEAEFRLLSTFSISKE